MKIRSLHVEHFRKFVGPTSITNLADGVNVLAERNEFGKSTLFSAVRCVLFERHNSNTVSVKAMRHWVNKTAPRITLEFELGGKPYKVTKRFLDKASASLTLPNGAVYSDEEAEEELQTLLQFTRAGKGGMKPEHMGMWDALWVTQGQSFHLPTLHETASRTIQACLEQEVGSLTGGAKGTEVLKSVREEIAALRNGLQKPVGKYKAAIAEAEAAANSIAALELKQRELSKDLEDFDATERAISYATSSGQDVRLDADLAEARTRKESAERYSDRERSASSEYEVAQNRFAALEKAAKYRADLCNERQESTVKTQIARELAEGATRLREAADEALSAHNERAGSLEDARDEAVRNVREARTLVEFARQAETLVRLRTRLAEAETAQEFANNLAAKLLASPITESQVEAIENAIANLDRVSSALDAQATIVTLKVRHDARTSLLANGIDTREDTQLRVIEDLVLDVEGLGTITIQPAIKDRDLQLGRKAEFEREVRNSLADAHVETLDGARKKLLQQQNWERELAAAKKEVLRLTTNDSGTLADGGIQIIRDKVAVIDQTLQAELARRSIAEFPSLDSVQTDLRTAEVAEKKAEEALAIAKAPLSLLQKDRDDSFSKEATALASLETAISDLARIAAELEDALQLESDSELATKRSAASDDVFLKRGLLEQVQRDKPSDSAANMDTRIARLEEARKQFEDDLNLKRRERAVLESRIERDSGIGIGEQLKEAERRREFSNRQVAWFEQELAVLDLLRTTLEGAELEAKEKYMAPVVRRIVPYLQRLFPNATIRCDENFCVTGISRDTEEDFDKLSDGTQEQIAILTRLAFAEMLIDGGRHAMLVLDDALAYSDNDRLETMFDILTEASAKLQIVVLTCREDAFRRLGGSRIRVHSSERV